RSLVGELGLLGTQHPAHRVARDLEQPHDLFDRATFNEMPPPNPAYRLHAQHPFGPAKSAGDYRGQISTREPLLRGSVLQADSHSVRLPYHWEGSPALQEVCPRFPDEF